MKEFCTLVMGISLILFYTKGIDACVDANYVLKNLNSTIKQQNLHVIQKIMEYYSTICDNFSCVLYT